MINKDIYDMTVDAIRHMQNYYGDNFILIGLSALHFGYGYEFEDFAFDIDYISSADDTEDVLTAFIEENYPEYSITNGQYIELKIDYCMRVTFDHFRPRNYFPWAKDEEPETYTEIDGFVLKDIYDIADYYLTLQDERSNRSAYVALDYIDRFYPDVLAENWFENFVGEWCEDMWTDLNDFKYGDPDIIERYRCRLNQIGFKC